MNEIKTIADFQGQMRANRLSGQVEPFRKSYQRIIVLFYLDYFGSPHDLFYYQAIENILKTFLKIYIMIYISAYRLPLRYSLHNFHGK